MYLVDINFIYVYSLIISKIYLECNNNDAMAIIKTKILMTQLNL